MKKDQKGSLIVIDGSDGSGKATQTKLLVEALGKEGKDVKSIDFPRYDTNLVGELIGECLAGEHGDFASFDPKVASVLYAADRFESSKQIQEWIAGGSIVITDRYVSANQIHQGGKIYDPEEKKEFLLWLDKLEYGIFEIPRPDVVLYLDVPAPTTKKLLAENKEEMKKKKEYLKRREDVVESDDTYIENSIKSATQIVKERNEWCRIQCTEGGELLSRESIHRKVLKEVKKIISSN